MGRQRGFSLIEVLVCSAVAFFLGWVLLAIASEVSSGASRLAQLENARTATDRLADRLEADAASAWSAFVPPVDVNGAGNADGHEIDFVTEDGAHRQFWWAYLFDATASRATQYAYSPGGAQQAGASFDGITLMRAKAYDVTSLFDASSAIYDPLFANSTASAVDFDYGWNPHALGGNRIVRLRLQAPGVDRELILTSATAPTHYTVLLDYTPPPVSP